MSNTLPFTPHHVTVKCISRQPGQSSGAFWYQADLIDMAMRFALSQVSPLYHQVTLEVHPENDATSFAVKHLTYDKDGTKATDWRTWNQNRFVGGCQWPV
jgi:hypothetical protein